MQINSKIIFITDGHPTEGTLCQGPDKGDPDLEDEVIILMTKTFINPSLIHIVISFLLNYAVIY